MHLISKLCAQIHCQKKNRRSFEAKRKRENLSQKENHSNSHEFIDGSFFPRNGCIIKLTILKWTLLSIFTLQKGTSLETTAISIFLHRD